MVNKKVAYTKEDVLTEENISFNLWNLKGLRQS